MTDGYDEQLLLGYVEGDLSDADRLRVERWMEDDPRLARLLEAMEGNRRALTQLPDPTPPDWIMDGINSQLERAMLVGDLPHEDPAVVVRHRHVLRKVFLGGAIAAMLAVVAGVVVLSLTDVKPVREFAFNPPAEPDSSPPAGVAEEDSGRAQPDVELAPESVEAPERGAESEEPVAGRGSGSEADPNPSTTSAPSGPSSEAADDDAAVMIERLEEALIAEGTARNRDEEMVGEAAPADQGAAAVNVRPRLADDTIQPPNMGQPDALADARQGRAGGRFSRDRAMPDEFGSPVRPGEVQIAEPLTDAPQVYARGGLGTRQNLMEGSLAHEPARPNPSVRMELGVDRPSVAANPPAVNEPGVSEVDRIVERLRDRPGQAEEWELHIVSRDPAGTRRLLESTLQSAESSEPVEQHAGPRAEGAKPSIEEAGETAEEFGEIDRSSPRGQSAEAGQIQDDVDIDAGADAGAGSSTVDYSLHVTADRLPAVIEALRADDRQVSLRFHRRSGSSDDDPSEENATVPFLTPWPTFGPDFGAILHQYLPADTDTVHLPVIIERSESSQ